MEVPSDTASETCSQSASAAIGLLRQHTVRSCFAGRLRWIT